MSFFKSLAAAATVAVLGTSAYAIPVVTFSQNNSLPAAAQTAGFEYYDVTVQLADGEDWTNTDLRVDLTSGTIGYQPAPGDLGPSSAFWGFVPTLQGGSFVSGPAFADPTILGGVDANLNNTPPPAIKLPNAMGVAYGDTSSAGAGTTFVNARIRVSVGAADAVGTVRGKVFTTQTGPNNPVLFNFPIPIPEPTSLAAVAGLGAMALRRRRA